MASLSTDTKSFLLKKYSSSALNSPSHSISVVFYWLFKAVHLVYLLYRSLFLLYSYHVFPIVFYFRRVSDLKKLPSHILWVPHLPLSQREGQEPAFGLQEKSIEEFLTSLVLDYRIAYLSIFCRSEPIAAWFESFIRSREARQWTMDFEPKTRIFKLSLADRAVPTMGLHIRLHNAFEEHHLISSLSSSSAKVKALWTIDTLDAALKSHAFSSDPELLISTEPSFSLQGLPPWSIRLTEFSHRPCRYAISRAVLRASLYQYANCQQRFGI